MNLFNFFVRRKSIKGPISIEGWRIKYDKIYIIAHKRIMYKKIFHKSIIEPHTYLLYRIKRISSLKIFLTRRVKNNVNFKDIKRRCS